jgi:hypothetical protein
MARGSRLRAFTLPEAVVTAGLLVLFLITLGGLYFQGKLFADGEDLRSRRIGERKSLVTILSPLCQRIRVPEWASSERVFTDTDGKLSAMWLDGDPKQGVDFKVDSGVLTVSSFQGTWKWQTLTGVLVQWWTQDSRIVGLKLAWTEDGEKRALALPWGGIPL